MRQILIVVLGLLMILSIVLWVSGAMGFVVTSWLSSGKAELIGMIMFSLACLGELGLYFFGWTLRKMDKTDPHVVQKYRLK